MPYKSRRTRDRIRGRSPAAAPDGVGVELLSRGAIARAVAGAHATGSRTATVPNSTAGAAGAGVTPSASSAPLTSGHGGPGRLR